METSILNSVKKDLGVNPEYDVYDNSIIMGINSAFMVLTQLGVGPPQGFRISDASSVWTDFMPNADENFESVKSYISMKTRLIFDPPTSSIHQECIKQLVNEFEWRLNFEAEYSK